MDDAIGNISKYALIGAKYPFHYTERTEHGRYLIKDATGRLIGWTLYEVNAKMAVANLNFKQHPEVKNAYASFYSQRKPKEPKPITPRQKLKRTRLKKLAAIRDKTF